MKRFLLLLSVFSVLKVSSQLKINWLTWSEKTFALAKTERKPVFLDVGTEWCTACNLMEEKTYVDSVVIQILNSNFICIKADAEVQPDVGARFLEWGWPALIFLDIVLVEILINLSKYRHTSEVWYPVRFKFLLFII